MLRRNIHKHNMTSTDKKFPHYWNEACKHLSAYDKIMAGIIKNYAGEVLHSKGDAFYTLARAIVGQQISVKAADTIWGRFEKLCNGDPYPAIIMGLSDTELRGTGFSASKVKYMRAVAEEFAAGQLSHAMLEKMSDEEIQKRLIKLPGIGRWTVEMFLIFCLLRSDIFPINDLGLRKAINKHYGGGDEVFADLSAGWQPYRTVATWYLWRSLDPEPIEY
jgi:DNA-3-methyladenine glycosylase II